MPTFIRVLVTVVVVILVIVAINMLVDALALPGIVATLLIVLVILAAAYWLWTNVGGRPLL